MAEIEQIARSKRGHELADLVQQSAHGMLSVQCRGAEDVRAGNSRANQCGKQKRKSSRHYRCAGSSNFCSL